MVNELTTTTATTTSTDLAHANLARYAKDAQGAFAPNTVRALRADTAIFTAWCLAAGVPALGDALDSGDVEQLFKAMVRTAGLTPEQVARISGHSSRVCAAQDMAASNRIEMPAIMQAGGWKSPQMVARYTQRQAARRSGAAKLAELQNRV